jgi:hypothetical protein
MKWKSAWKALSYAFLFFVLAAVVRWAAVEWIEKPKALKLARANGITQSSVQSLSVLRGDYWLRSGSKNWTVNILTGAIIPWESAPR